MRSPLSVKRSVFGLMVALLAATALLMSGCAAKEPVATTPEQPAEQVAATFPVTITDDLGREVTVNEAPEKIVSLAPGNTEMLFAMGAGDRVVGVTSYDDYPAEVADIEKIGDFTGPNVEKIASLSPDLILATSGVQEDVIAQLEGLGATVVVIDPASIDGLLESLTEIGQITGQVAEAQSVVDGMNKELEAIDAEAAKIVARTTTAFLEIGQNPLYTVGQGTLLNDLLTRAGAQNIVPEEGYVPYSAEQVLAKQPDVYFATAGSGSTADDIAKRPGHNKLSAVKNGRVVVLDENTTSRPGPRIVEGLKAIQVALSGVTKE